MIKNILIISLFLIIILSLQLSFERFNKGMLKPELLYFPKGENIKYFLSGFDNIFADFLWIRGGVYFGEERISKGRFEYLFHIYDVITSIDIRFLNAYILGAFLIKYHLKNLELAVSLIDKGLNMIPDEWILHFYKGFMYYISFDFGNAYKSFFIGSRFEKGSSRCKKFAYMSLIKERGVKELLYEWVSLYEKSSNMYMKEIAIEGMKETIRYAMKRFEIERKYPPKDIYELLKEGYIPFIPKLEGNIFRIKDGEVIW